jgi:hypothetical protein
VRVLAAGIWTVWMFVGLRWGLWLAARHPDDAPSNCLLWAIQQQRRHGGELRMTASLFGPWLHTRWVGPDGSAWEYNPPRKRRRRIPPPLFYGRAERKS